mgnify:CR=1 FL=1|jgi:hypothetical protein
MKTKAHKLLHQARSLRGFTLIELESVQLLDLALDSLLALPGNHTQG